MKPCRSRVLAPVTHACPLHPAAPALCHLELYELEFEFAPVIGAFAGMPSDLGALAGVIVPALANENIQFFYTSAVGTGSASGRRGTTQSTGGGPASCLTAAGGSSPMDPGQLAAQVENSTTRSSSVTAATTAATLSSSTLAPAGTVRLGKAKV